MAKNELEDLAIRIGNGDRDAEQALFKQLSPRIELIVRTRLVQQSARDDLDDIVNDVMVSLLESLRKGNFDASRNYSLSTYTAGIAQKHIALYFRNVKRNREYTQKELPDIEDGAPSYLDGLIQNEEKEKLRSKLSTLNALYRKILLLRYFEENSVTSICESLGFKRKKVVDLTHNAFKTFIKKCRNDDYFSIFSLLVQIFM